VLLFGAILRAFLVVTVVIIPALILPSAPPGAVEFALTIGGIIGMFTLFEYGTSSPGFVDFRFAPPYNRFRAFTIASQIIFVTLVCRAAELNLQSATILDWAQNLTSWLDFKYSPVAQAINVVVENPNVSDTSAVLLVYTISMSFAIGFGFTALFSTLLWLFKWPSDRANFNLWINMPMFQPSNETYVSKRLRRDGHLNIIIGIVLIYALPYAPIYVYDWFSVDVFSSDQAIVWATTLWVFVPSTLMARAFAMIKIAKIIDKAHR